MRSIFKVAFALTVLCVLPFPSRAQFIGYTSPQTVTQQIFSGVNTTQTSPASNSNQAACSTIPISTPACAIPNLGQSIHYVAVRASAARNFRLTLEGSDDGVNWFAMAESSSDAGGNGATPGFAGFSATGSFSAYRLNLQVGNGSGSLSVWYSGTSTSTGQPGGSFNASATYRRILALAPNSALTLTAVSSSVYPTTGNTSGTLFFQFQSNPCATGSLAIQSGVDTQHLAALATIIPASNTTLQTFSIPASPAGVMTFGYTACGTETYDTFMLFAPAGSPSSSTQYTHITTTTATVVKGTPGFLHTLSINLGAAGTVSVFDLPSASCTATPSTNQIAIITATATTLQTFVYDVNLLQGICVKASVAMDLTVSAQ